MSILIERPLAVRSDGLLLEARLHEAEPAAFAAVVLHPHPQYGGDMDNHVVATLCETLAASPATTLRVNFRGAGRSEGAFDGGRGEVNDARAAVVALRSAAPGLPLVLIGYSFGAMIAAALLADSISPSADALILVSPPIANSALPGATHQLPTLVLTGDQDAISPAAAVSVPWRRRPDVQSSSPASPTTGIPASSGSRRKSPPSSTVSDSPAAGNAAPNRALPSMSVSVVEALTAKIPAARF